MDGASSETLAFLIDIQEHGANNLRALSADFSSLGTVADRIGKQLATMQAQLDRAAASGTAAGEKLAAGAKASTAATDAQAKSAEGLATVQKSQVGTTDAVAAATERLTKVQKTSADAGKASAAGLDAQAAAAKRASGAAGAAAGGSKAHSGALDEHASKLKKVETGLGSFGRAMNNVSLPIIAVGGYALKMGLDFEAAMQRLHGQAGYAQKDIGGLEAAVLKAAPHLARTPNELADALYHVASVGIPAAQAMQVVSAASIAANIGNANLENTTNGLVIVMKSLHQPASMAKEDMALLNEVVGAGNLRMEDLVGSLGKVLPQAQSFGLHLQDVGAAMDVMTSRGINAEMAATRLGMTFNLMGNPSVTAQKSLATIGLSANTLAEDMHKPNGLLVAVEDLKSHLDKTFPASGSRKLSVEEERSALQTYKKQLEETGVSGKALTKDLEEYADKLVHMGSAAVQQAQVLSSSFGRGRQSATILTLVQNVDDLRKMYERLPEGAKALERLTDAQDKWEKTSSAQFDVAKATITTSMTEIGKSLGPEVVPVIKDLAGDIEGLVHMFEGLPTPVQHTVEEVTALIAVLGPAALLMSKLIGAGRAVGSAGGWVAGKFSSSGAAAGEAGAAGAAGEAGAVSTAERVGGMVGVRGPVEYGGLMNPIAVQVVGYGTSIGSGGSSTGSAAERDAAAAEERSPGGVILPSGVSSEAAAAEEAVGAGGVMGLGGRVASIGKSLAGGALKGGAIALGGMAVSDIAGGIIGGKTGSAVGSIGSDAAMGAGLGSLIGPEGTIGGAAVGALVGGLKVALDQPSFGEKMADTLAQGMTPAARKAIENTFNAEHNYQTERGRPTRGGAPARVTESNKEAYGGGSAIAAGVEHHAESFKFPDLGTFTKEAFKYFDQIPARARSAGIQSIIAWTAGMEANGRLPQGATEKLISSIEKQWPEYTSYLREVGLGSQRELAKTLEDNVAVEAAKKQIAQVSQAFQGLAPLLKKDGGNAQEEWRSTLDFLVGQTHSKMPQVRVTAEDELHKLTANTSSLMDGWSHDLAESLRAGGAGAANNFVAGMRGMVGGIEKLMKEGSEATKTGDAEIVKLAAGALGALGGSASKGVTNFLKSFATGGRVPGSGLEDTVPVMSPAGAVRGIVAPGELLIANRHTEGRVDQMLAPYGTSLGAEVAGEMRPHSAPLRRALGGWIRTGATIDPTQGQAPTYSAHGGMSFAELLEAGVNAGKRPDLTQLLGEPRSAYGMAMETPILVRAVGGKQAFRVWKNDVGSGQAGESHYTIDLHSAIASALGFPGKGDIEVAKDGTSSAAAIHGGGAASGTGNLRMPPWKGPGGIIGQTGRASVASVLHAVNQKLAAQQNATGGGQGGGASTATGKLPTGGGFSPSQVGSFDGISVADWIIPELNYARAHGWTGPITSGVRLGFDPHAPSGSEHALDIWPGGAVDFGGMVDPAGAANREAFEAATRGFEGKHLIRATGFRDDGHMSGTGHARGGRMSVGSFGQGGVATANSPTTATFGENGPETAIFVPHNLPRFETGGELLESIGVTPTAPAGSKAVEGLNPDNNKIEYHTAAEWRSIRLHHEQAQKAKGPSSQVEDQIQIGRQDVGSILSKTSGTINIPKDVGHLSAETWKKVVAAIEHTLKETSGPANAAFDVQAVGKLAASGSHNARLRELTGSAIQSSAKTILTVTKNLPAEDAVAGGSSAINQLRKLITDAKRSGNANLTSALRKDIETEMKGTASAIMQNVAGAPAGRAVSSAAGGVQQLQSLIAKARANGSHTLELTLIKDVQKTVATWQSAITSTASTATESAGAKEKVRLALRNLQTVKTQGGGAKLLKAEADPEYLRDEEAAQTTAIHQMEAERAQLAKLVKQLDAQMQKALKKHHKAQAKAIEAEIREINSQIGEVTTSIGESTANVAQLQIEFAQHVYEEVKDKIAEAQSTFESQASMASIGQQIRQQELKNAGGTQSIAEVRASVAAQVAPLEGERSYDQANLGLLSGADHAQMEQKIAELTLSIVQLDGTVQEQIAQKLQEVNAEFEGQGNMASLRAQINQQELHNQGLDLSGLQEDASKQSGLLTPQQLKQAETDLQSFIAGVKAQEAPIEQQRAYDEAHLGELTGPARAQMEQTILQLGLNLAQLQGTIVDQTHATEQLTEATKTSNTTMAQFTGAVTYSFNNQSYVIGQTSDLSVTPAVGG